MVAYRRIFNVRSMNYALHLLTAAAMSIAGSPAFAQTSKDYAAMGAASWAAFECSSLAAHANNREQQERLFLYGYKMGQEFVKAVLRNKVDRKDLLSDVPSGFVMMLEGPSIDFILGRVFENAQDNALKGVLVTNGELNPPELQAAYSETKFQKANCRLVGK